MNKCFSSDTLRFIEEHRNDDVRMLALQASKYPSVDMAEAVVQISGWQVAAKKVPLWAQTEGIIYPKHLSMEQCSSEMTARYKASLVRGESLVDLTAGFGIDCSFLARNFKKVSYVECQEELCELAKHNFPLLGLEHIQVCHADGVEFLQTMEPVDCLFVDPARRDSKGGKTVAIGECEPDICALEEVLVEKGRLVMVKLSPMLDVASALRDLKYVDQVHVVAVHNECKELVLLLSKGKQPGRNSLDEIAITCEQFISGSLSQHFSFTFAQEKAALCPMAEEVNSFLYEPGAALLKAGPYRLLADRYDVRKLHANSHLYTSVKKVDFPGRCFEVIGVSGFGRKELKSFLAGVDKANLTVRNFPASVAELRKKLKLKEGGELYLFATTLNNGERVLIKSVKAR